MTRTSLTPELQKEDRERKKSEALNPVILGTWEIGISNTFKAL